MIYDVASVVSHAVDEAGVSAMLEVLTHDVQTRRRSDTSLLANRAVRLQNWNSQPAVVWAIASGDDHGPNVLAGQV
jgi:hypothetical protein